MNRKVLWIVLRHLDILQKLIDLIEICNRKTNLK
jgi:hypothetical protein